MYANVIHSRCMSVGCFNVKNACLDVTAGGHGLRRWADHAHVAYVASVGRQATLSVGTYRMVRVGETRPSAGMYRIGRDLPFHRDPHTWTHGASGMRHVCTDDRQPRTHTIYSLRPGGDAGSMASRDIRELPEWVRPLLKSRYIGGPTAG